MRLGRYLTRRLFTEQSKTKGKKAVEEVVRLRNARNAAEREIARLELVMVDAESDFLEVESAEERVEALKASSAKTLVQLRMKERALGVQEQEDVRKLMKSPYIQKRMNARALKIRIRDLLRSRKFEFDRIERSFRKQVNGTSSLFFQSQTLLILISR